MATTPQDELSRLREQLDEVTRREARYRLESVQDYLELHAKFREQGSTIGERGTLIHKLNLGEIAAREALQAAHADLEVLIWKLHNDELLRRKSWGGKLRALLGSLAGKRTPPPPGAQDTKVPPGDFDYYLHTSPYRLFRGERFVLRGWAIPRDGSKVEAVRVRLAGQEFNGTYGIAEPEVAKRRGAPSANPLPGFEIEFPTPPGKHMLRLEARLEGSGWVSILNAPAWCKPGQTTP